MAEVKEKQQEDLFEEKEEINVEVEEETEELPVAASAEDSIKSQLAEAKRALKGAYEEGDSEAMADAQEVVAKLSVENDRVLREQARLEAQEKEAPAQTVSPEPAQPVAQPQAPLDPRAKQWADENEWFGKDEAMTFTAFSIHRRLIEEEGYDPSSEDYQFEGQKSGSARRPAQTVAPASRNVKSGRKTVRLTQSQVAIAKKLGVPLEEYARHVKEA